MLPNAAKDIGTPVCHHDPETCYKTCVPYKRNQLSGNTAKENKMINTIKIISFTAFHRYKILQNVKFSESLISDETKTPEE